MSTLQQLGASDIDTNLARLDFFDRICLVKASPSTNFAFTPGPAGQNQTVSVNKLWPALKFNSIDELQIQLKKDTGTKVTGRTRAKFTTEANRLAREAGVGLESVGFAYLLGKGETNCLTLLPKNVSGELTEEGVIFDFYENQTEMQTSGGYCSSSEFQNALNIALARLEMEEALIEDGEEAAMQFQVANANSARKALQAKEMEVQPQQQQQQNHQYQQEEEEVDEVACADETPRRLSPRKKKKKDTARNVPVDTVEFCASDELTDWKLMWDKMRDEGWTHCRGRGLVSWYYVHPSFADRSCVDIFKEGKEGTDYFCDDEAVKRYAKEFLGYRGPVESLPQGGRRRSAAVEVTYKPATTKQAKEKKVRKKETKEKKVRKKETKTQSNPRKRRAINETVVEKETNERETEMESGSISDGSHFSGGRGRGFDRGSPYGSDFEGMMGGMQSGSKPKKLTYGARDQRNTDDMHGQHSESDNVESEPEDTESETSESDDKDDIFQVMSSTDAWKLLMEHFGFKYFKGKYCLPGKENRPGEDAAIEGRHYFTTLMGLRKHLCAYGLPECQKRLEFADVAAIRLWVRFAHVKGLPEAALVSPADVGGCLNFKEAWSMLLKLGITWNGNYVIEDDNNSGEPKRFEKQEDMIVHLARFGIPNINSSTNIGLAEDDRLRLDLYITDANIDCFKQIDPEKENLNEITPRKTRGERSGDGKGADYSLLQLSPAESQQALVQEDYWAPFDDLNTQREMDLSQIDSENAYKLLREHFNFSEVTSYDSAYYGTTFFCFPGAGPSQKFKCGVDFFESLQDLREYLCAFGLPPRPKKNTRISDNDMAEIEQWIRSAHIRDPYDEDSMTNERLKSKEVKNILKGLGYRFSKNFQFYLLPNASCHKSQAGKDRFDRLIDLFNHIARFGLSSSEGGGACSVAELQRLQLFIASIATYDVTKRIDSTQPLLKRAPIALKPPPVATKPFIPDSIVSEVEVKTPEPVPVVMDQEDTPEPQQQTPQKKKGLLNYFKVGVSSVLKAAMTPSKCSSQNQDAMKQPSKQCTEEAAESNSTSSTLEDTSSPSVKEMAVDNDIEATNKDPGHLKVKTVDYSLTKTQRRLPWAKLWKEMRSEGWSYTSGNGLTADFYYIHARHNGKKKTEVLTGEKGWDYFESEEEVQAFAKDHLGWKGEKEFSTPGQTMMSSPGSSHSTNKRKDRKTDNEKESPSKKARSQPQQEHKLTTSPTRRSKAQFSPNSNHSVSSSEGGESEYIPLPDQQVTYKDKLEYCKLMLHPSRLLTTERVVFGVEQLEKKIELFMTRAIGTGYDIDGMTGQSPGFMYICGGPGTGKSTAVATCSQNLSKLAKERGYVKPCYCNINMASNFSMGTVGVRKEMLKRMAKKLEIDNKSSLDVFEKKFRSKGMILVVDEIDMLFKDNGNSGEEWFSTLIEWCEDKDLPFSMIGISNSVNDASATKIRELGNNPFELVFPTYNEANLLAILEKRVGKKIVDTKALQLISKRVAASTGDARKALEITSNAVDKAFQACEEKWRDEVEDSSYPLVKLPHMMRAIREGMPTRHEEIIRGLPQAAKVILCIAVSLGKVWGPTAAVSIATLKKYAVEATKRSMLENASIGQISNLVEMLMDSGLLTTDHNGNFNANDHSSLLHIGVQLDDVEIALEKSLLGEEFYSGLVEYVKRECPRPEYQI